MTEQELQAIEERWRKATPGNWGWIIRGNSVQSHAVVCHDDAKSLMSQNICSGISPKTGNAQAIANAPTDIANLLAEVRRLQAESKAKECCGNCRNSAINFSGGSKMLCKMRIMGAMNNYAKEKCEKWQGVK